MTFDQVCKSHEPNEQLAFSHPDFRGVAVFNESGQMLYFDSFGHKTCAPFWLSDFDRDDWYLIPNEDD